MSSLDELYIVAQAEVYKSMTQSPVRTLEHPIAVWDGHYSKMSTSSEKPEPP